MATNTVLSKYGSRTALTCTLASLASSTTRVGRQTDYIDLSASLKPRLIWFFFQIKLGTSPTADTAIYVYPLFGNGTERDNNFGTTDAAITLLAGLIPWVHGIGSAATGDTMRFSRRVWVPPGEICLGIYHDTGVALDNTGSNHVVSYQIVNPDIQEAA